MATALTPIKANNLTVELCDYNLARLSHKLDHTPKWSDRVIIRKEIDSWLDQRLSLTQRRKSDRRT